MADYKLDLTKPGHNVFYGDNDEGKSTILQYVVKQAENHRIAIIDYHDEYTKLDNEPNVDRFIPTERERNDPQERMDFFRWCLDAMKRTGYDLIIIEEFNQYVKNTKFETPYELQDMKNNIAHKSWNNATSILIMRLPSQGDSEFRETARHIIVAGNRGNNAQSQLNDVADGLGDVSRQVLGTHKFGVLDRNTNLFVCEPVPEENATRKHE